ncbi:outer membrane protein transport protein [Desulfobacterales bacterium HSG16]|nr:outer membrane protein transport protein [Desulfobacterales bacterium HSG16]
MSFADDFLQRIEIPSSPNPVGSGARALGMGGAFIGVADDATAASWNPGGLIQLELPEISFVATGFHRIDDNSFGNNPEASGSQTVSKTSINYLSAAYPFQLFERNMIVSINYQNLYDFTRKWSFPIHDKGIDWYADQNVDYQSDGSLSALGIAYCVQISPRVSVGMTLNLWNDWFQNNEWETRQYQWATGEDGGDAFTFEARSIDKYSFSGLNANFGMLWKINSRLHLGAVIKTPFDADLKIRHTSFVSRQYTDLGYGSSNEIDESENGKLRMPLSVGIGISYRFSKEFTASMDLYRTEWDDFILETGNGKETSPVTGLSAAESNIDPTYQARIGAEYLFIKPKYVVPVRGGIFYDPAPAQGSPDHIFGFSIGSGFVYERFVFDIAYQHRFGSDAGTSILKAWGFSQDIEEHTMHCSLIVYF